MPTPTELRLEEMVLQLMSSNCYGIDIYLIRSSKATRTLIVSNIGCKYFTTAEQTLVMQTSTLVFLAASFHLSKYHGRGLVPESLKGMFPSSVVTLCEAGVLLQSNTS